MTVKTQRPIKWENTCKAIYDNKLLEEAVLWYSSHPVRSKKKVFISAKYPAVAIRKEKLHIHRLIYSYINNGVPSDCYVHHKNGNKLDATTDNLEAVNIKEHQSMHNRGKTISEEHKESIRKSNRTRYENPELLKELNK